MSILSIKQAVKVSRYPRLVIDGKSGSGKTYTSLLVGCELAKRAGGRLCVIDTEGDSAMDYADTFDFDHASLSPPYTPERYIAAMRQVRDAGFPVCLVDSFSHMWAGSGGELEMVNTFEDKHKFSKGWRKVTPLHNQVLHEILTIEMGIIATLRMKAEYVIEKNAKGFNEPKMIGVKPIMRDEFEYEFQFAGTMDAGTLRVTKSRMDGVFSEGDEIVKPGLDFAGKVWDWLNPGGGEYKPVAQERAASVESRELSLADFTDEERALVKAKHPDIRNVASLRLRFPGWTKEQVMAEVTK